MYLGSKAIELCQCFQDREGALWKNGWEGKKNNSKEKEKLEKWPGSHMDEFLKMQLHGALRSFASQWQNT